MDYQVVLFDFDGVLSRGRFYSGTLLPDYKNVYDWLQSNIFGDKELVKRWMRNQVNSQIINELIAKKTGIDYELLNKLFRQSIIQLELDQEIISLAKSMKLAGNKIGLVTDNMDIFTEITVPHHQLDSIFDVIINSADYGILKKEENGRLFDIALNVLGNKIENSLMIDDCESTIDLFKQKGGHGFHYQNISDLKNYLQS